jgi:hypothetical protein
MQLNGKTLLFILHKCTISDEEPASALICSLFYDALSVTKAV